MGTAAAGERDECRVEGQSIRGRGSANSFLAILVVVQVALTAGLYFQNFELKMSEDEKQAQITSLREQVDALHSFFENEVSKLSQQSCPPCPSLQQKMEATLRNVHRDFESTAEKLNASVNNLHATINLHATKIAGLAEKAQNSPILKLFQNM